MKKTKEQKPDLDIDLLRTHQSWHYYLDYDCDWDYDCDNSGCDGICRCGTITNTKIKSVNIAGIAEKLCSKSNPLLAYATNRILTHSKLMDPNTWDLETGGGYYGEEVYGARFSYDAAPYEALSNLLSYKDNPVELIKAVLQHEYSYILPELEGITSCTIEKVPVEDISIGQKDHYKRLDRKIVESYSDYELPVGVCLETDGGLKLIDGYHRLAAAINKKKKSVDIIVVK